MAIDLFGHKLGMTRVFEPSGKSYPVTILKMDLCISDAVTVGVTSNPLYLSSIASAKPNDHVRFNSTFIFTFGWILFLYSKVFQMAYIITMTIVTYFKNLETSKTLRKDCTPLETISISPITFSYINEKKGVMSLYKTNNVGCLKCLTKEFVDLINIELDLIFQCMPQNLRTLNYIVGLLRFSKPQECLSLVLKLLIFNNVTLMSEQIVLLAIVKNALKVGQKVKITGKTIGKGFSGNQARYGFNQGLTTHGSKNHRLPGSIGAGSTPGRVFPGKRMAGRCGNQFRTGKNEVFYVNLEEEILLVKGSIAGKRGSLVRIKPLSFL
jgi:ribosomal protein L3